MKRNAPDDMVNSNGVAVAATSVNQEEDAATAASASSSKDNNKKEQEQQQPLPGAMDWVLHNYDANTTYGPNIDVELSRLQALKSFHLLDRGVDASYQRLASLAARLFDTSMAIINLVDLGRVWQVASHGISNNNNNNNNYKRQIAKDSATKNNMRRRPPLVCIPRETPRTTSVCAHTILQKDLLLVVPDLRQDVRFRDSPLARAGVGFYAGTPLISPEGAHIGTLCILDHNNARQGGGNSHLFGEEQQEQLADLAATIMDFMAEKRQSALAQANPQYNPGSTYPYQVQRAASFLRQQLARLKDDADYQTVASEEHQHALQSAFKSADFLFSSLVMVVVGQQQPQHSPGNSNSSSRSSTGTYRRQNNNLHDSAPASSSSLLPLTLPSSSRIGQVRAVEMDTFVKSLETAMEAFPRKVNLSLSLHPELPAELVFNDLKVFRSAIALLTSACERTVQGFIRLRVYAQNERSNGSAFGGGNCDFVMLLSDRDDLEDVHTTPLFLSQPQQHTRQQTEPQQRVVVFECEDTGRDVDLDRFERLFQTPPAASSTAQGLPEPEECIRIDHTTGQVERTAVVCNFSNEPVSGGFAVYPVAEYIGSMGGKYGFRPRFVQSSSDVSDISSNSNRGEHASSSGSIFWFSIPLRTVTATQRSGTRSALDSAIDSALDAGPLADISQGMGKVNRNLSRAWC